MPSNPGMHLPLLHQVKKNCKQAYVLKSQHHWFILNSSYFQEHSRCSIPFCHCMCPKFWKMASFGWSIKSLWWRWFDFWSLEKYKKYTRLSKRTVLLWWETNLETIWAWTTVGSYLAGETRTSSNRKGIILYLALCMLCCGATYWSLLHLLWMGRVHIWFQFGENKSSPESTRNQGKSMWNGLKLHSYQYSKHWGYSIMEWLQ